MNARVVLLTNVALEHTDVLGDTLEQIAREKLAVAEHASIVVLPDETHAHLVDGSQVVLGGARAAAEAFVGHPIAAEPVVSLAGRFEQRDSEVRDGAHNPDGMRYLVNRLRGSEPQGTAPDYTVVTSILADKDADAMLRELRQVASRLVATSSSSDRALPAAKLAQLARPHFDRVEAVADPVEALARGHELGEPVLVAGSLYLLGDLAQAEQER